MIEKQLPPRILFSLCDLEELGFMKISTLKKFISKGNITAVKVGNKLFITREEVIRYFYENIVKVSVSL